MGAQGCPQLDGVEVSRATLWRWFILHTVVLSILVVAALVVAWRPRRRATSQPVIH